MIVRRLCFIFVCSCGLFETLLVVVKASAAAAAADKDVVGKTEAEEISCSNNAEGICKSDSSKEENSAYNRMDASECGVWLALSTLPGTGIGMFAGKNFSNNEAFLLAGDHTVPIVDLVANHGPDEVFFLWDEYTWNAKGLYMENLGAVETNVASPGFGAAANSFMDFVNADELYPAYSIPHGLHRRSDPGAGAFTYYHSRYTDASSNVIQGQELFVNYGSTWFLNRKEKLGPIPVKGDHKQADRMYRKFRQKFIDQEQQVRAFKSHRWGNQKDVEANGDGTQAPPSLLPEPSKPKLVEAATELWDTFVLNSAWEDSPTMAALPPKEEYDDMYKQTLTSLKKSRMTRSTDWLAENGVCADTMKFGESTIHQAGHGAFASRYLPEGAVTLPIPFIHIPNRTVLDMYELHANPKDPELPVKGDKEQPRPPQLLLNYCLGHRDSTMLLSPYGPVFNLINHNQTLANVKLQWASPERSQHKPEMLDKNVKEFEKQGSAQLAMELVTVKDIEPGEEIFLDYGDEWEAAWQKHVEEWVPVEGADTYVSAFEMNRRFDHVYRTEFEQMREPYPSNLMLEFHKFFLDNRFRRNWVNKHPKTLRESMSSKWLGHRSLPCEILRYEEVDGRILYAIVVPADDEKTEWSLLEDVPREAIFFQDRPYTSDMFLKNAFRHDIRIPDQVFPEQWKNLKQEREHQPVV